ncbi:MULTISPECIES: hypothetical protein [Halalkalibacter]|uniref:Uncharacterized protein n=2 Tax=Halalkalibacter TaxID=2893056 RepID=W4Q698_9BACI|nr:MULTISPECIES: hypothetical protein [Halalkalibacter]MCL7748637.1 hypothetical protein [Halalkalibacter alkaliphilus]GAE27596.1 hypothetical protein JCM9140_3749 [Halalkalibacter wakoensis JCM 9140]
MSKVKEVKFPVKYCPHCGKSLAHKSFSFLNEYWKVDETVYFFWCAECDWQGEVKELKRFVAQELED